MAKQQKEHKKTADALDILYRRYVGDDHSRAASVEAERVNAEVARLIRHLRTSAQLTQAQLAELIETTQSAISRLEDADYEGHSLSVLSRIANVLNQRLTVTMTAEDPDLQSVDSVFPELARLLRRGRGLTVEELAVMLDVEPTEVRRMERLVGYKPSPRVLFKLSEFYDIPVRSLAALVGAVHDAPPIVREQASRFASRSDSFAKLTKEERHALDRLVRALRAVGNEETGADGA